MSSVPLTPHADPGLRLVPHSRGWPYFAALADDSGDLYASGHHVFALPIRLEMPACFAESGSGVLVATLVALDLVFPVHGAISGGSPIVIRTAMPEASAYLYGNEGGPEPHVSRSPEFGEGPGAHSVPEA
jgi:hypothetical protein